MLDTPCMPSNTITQVSIGSAACRPGRGRSRYGHCVGIEEADKAQVTIKLLARHFAKEKFAKAHVSALERAAGDVR